MQKLALLSNLVNIHIPIFRRSVHIGAELFEVLFYVFRFLGALDWHKLGERLSYLVFVKNLLQVLRILLSHIWILKICHTHGHCWLLHGEGESNGFV